jgi:RNA polymerase sigma factor (sigma-70 family)
VKRYTRETMAKPATKKHLEWRQKSIVEYAYLVKHIAYRFAVRLPSSVLLDELISAGSLGLIDAVDKFNPSKDVSLKTYAQYRIKGAILDELRSMDTYSRSMRKKIQDITKATKKKSKMKKGRLQRIQKSANRSVWIWKPFRICSPISMGRPF